MPGTQILHMLQQPLAKSRLASTWKTYKREQTNALHDVSVLSLCGGVYVCLFVGLVFNYQELKTRAAA